MSGRNHPEENSLLTKHVVAAGEFAKDAGSTPAASTIFLTGETVTAKDPIFLPNGNDMGSFVAQAGQNGNDMGSFV